MRASGVSVDPDLAMMRSDTVRGVVAGLLLAVVAMALVLALGRTPSPRPGDAACDPDAAGRRAYVRPAP